MILKVLLHTSRDDRAPGRSVVVRRRHRLLAQLRPKQGRRKGDFGSSVVKSEDFAVPKSLKI
jgi:hypothetical protein